MATPTPEGYYGIVDPDKDILPYTTPKTRWTMADLGFPSKSGVSPVAFALLQIFPDHVIERMRKELVGRIPPESCVFDENGVGRQIRGLAPKIAKFTYNVWTHEKTLSIVSRAARIDLIPSMDIEIGQVNIMYSQPNAKDGNNGPEETLPMDWHKGGFPFVGVVMLSRLDGDARGGEPCLRGPAGDKVVSGFSWGSVYLLQARYVEHRVLPFESTTKTRITSIISFRPKSSAIPDDSTLVAASRSSDPSRLYSEFCEYRFKNIHDLLLECLSSYENGDDNTLKDKLRGLLTFMVRTLIDVGGDEIPAETIREVAQDFQGKGEELRKERLDGEGFNAKQTKVFLMDNMISIMRLLVRPLSLSTPGPFSTWY